MLLKVYSADTRSWMYYELPKAFKIFYMNAQRDEFGQWSIWAIKGSKADAVDVKYDFDVLFSNGDTLFNFNIEHKKDKERIAECRLVIWKDDGCFEGVGIVGTGYIVNDSGKTIERV